jgi:hypothetical protein
MTMSAVAHNVTNIDDYPLFKEWYETMAAIPAVTRVRTRHLRFFKIVGILMNYVMPIIR